jgi:septal ring factor EnvC (AmiA/AmiB activator)
MTTPTFDTLRIAQALKEAGFDDSQAQAIVSAIRLSLGENVATKIDIGDVKTEIADVKTEIADVRTEIADVRTEIADVRTEIADVRTVIATEIGGVRTEIAASEARMVKWFAGLLIGTALGTVTATVALIKLLE